MLLRLSNIVFTHLCLIMDRTLLKNKNQSARAFEIPFVAQRKPNGAAIKGNSLFLRMQLVMALVFRRRYHEESLRWYLMRIRKTFFGDRNVIGRLSECTDIETILLKGMFGTPHVNPGWGIGFWILYRRLGPIKFDHIKIPTQNSRKMPAPHLNSTGGRPI